MTDSAQHKEAAQQMVGSFRTTLLDLSHTLHAAPEIAFAETHSAAAVADVLQANGFDVEHGVAELPTAFRATFGSGSLHIAICAEYDALVGVGHACGHNIIASAAVGAALALAPLADALDLTITVLGTPAEEGGGGKVFMLERGAFDGLHAALMVHPAAIERDAMATLANSQFVVSYTGKAAHAAAAPERGINAASAFVLAQAGIGMLREHLLSGDRVHGIVKHGGDAMNVIPARTNGHWCVRAESIEHLGEVHRRVVDVFKGAALMTGASLELRNSEPVYADVRTDTEMAALWRKNAAAIGRESLPIQPTDGPASTDMGNVSYAMPVIHPLIALDSNGANIHEAAFEACAGGETGDRAVVDGAVMMAWTVIDMATNGALRTRLLSKSFRVADVEPGAPWLNTRTDVTISFPPSH